MVSQVRGPRLPHIRKDRITRLRPNPSPCRFLGNVGCYIAKGYVALWWRLFEGVEGHTRTHSQKKLWPNKCVDEVVSTVATTMVLHVVLHGWHGLGLVHPSLLQSWYYMDGMASGSCTHHYYTYHCQHQCQHQKQSPLRKAHTTCKPNQRKTKYS